MYNFLDQWPTKHNKKQHYEYDIELQTDFNYSAMQTTGASYILVILWLFLYTTCDKKTHPTDSVIPHIKQETVKSHLNAHFRKIEIPKAYYSSW